MWNWLYLEEAGEQQQRLESPSILSTQEEGEGEDEDEDNNRMEKSVSVQFREEELSNSQRGFLLEDAGNFRRGSLINFLNSVLGTFFFYGIADAP